VPPSFLRASSVALIGAAAALGQTYEWRRAGEPAFRAGGTGLCAYDNLRHRMVALVADQTWVGDGAAWHLRASLPAGALQQPGMAFDRARGVTVLFGGAGTGGYRNATWTFDGATWSQVAAPLAPAGRWFSPLAYDVVRQRIVLSGGETQAALRNDTWEFDGSTWLQRFPVHSPSSYGRHGLVYDERRAVTVLFGGLTASAASVVGDTWEWDGVDWTQRFPAQSPPPRRNHGMAYDARRGRTVVNGGYAGASQSPVTDTWEYDGTNWVRTGLAGPAPPMVLTQQLAADPDRGGIVCLEGSGGQMRTWTFDGAQWRITLPAQTAGMRERHAMAHDPARGEMLLFGNWYLYGYPNYVATTWVQRGGIWAEAPGPSPPFLEQPALAADPAGGGVLLFGGSGPTSGLNGQTWHWTGTGWQLRAVAGPPPRLATAMASDTGRGRIVLFGGDNGAGGWLADTWEWHGSGWQQRLPAAAPPPREGHAMTFDPGRNRTVLFGGGDLLQLPTLGDHWEWDGAAWTQVNVALPPPRTSHSLVFDTSTQRVLLLGGQYLIASAMGVPRNDLWEWDGTVWTQRPMPQPAPTARRQTIAAHDARLGRTLLFGGEVDVDAWLLGPVSAAAVTSYGTGCPGAFGEPELVLRGQPFAGNPWFQARLSALLPGGLGLLALGIVPGNLPLLGGCTALLAPVQWLGGVADPQGALDVGLPIPNAASLRGIDVYAQAVSVDPAGAFAHALAFSSGRRVHID